MADLDLSSMPSATAELEMTPSTGITAVAGLLNPMGGPPFYPPVYGGTNPAYAQMVAGGQFAHHLQPSYTLPFAVPCDVPVQRPIPFNSPRQA